MSDLTEFLLARIDERKRLIESLTRAGAVNLPSGKVMKIYDGTTWTPILIEPKYMLAECEAHRRIVEEAQRYSPELEHGDNGEWAFDFVLRALASAYVDHPDWKPEWTQ